MSERHYNAETIDDLWIPGRSLDHAYPVPPAQELSAELHKGQPGEYVELEGVFGTMRIPAADEKIGSVISLDLCEVIRLTARAIASTGGKLYEGNSYLEGLWQDERFGVTETDFAYYTLQPIAQVMINHGMVEPVDGAKEISGMIRDWRKNGAYCVANTSTLPGCELGTIRFLNEHFPRCFDGIVFPRNHDGRGRMTKSAALSHVLDRLGDEDHSPEYVLHVDDTVHHIQGMLESRPHTAMHCFLPVYDGCLALDALSAEVKRADTPVGAFRLMDQHISELSQV